jgi:hypothetical protein
MVCEQMIEPAVAQLCSQHARRVCAVIHAGWLGPLQLGSSCCGQLLGVDAEGLFTLLVCGHVQQQATSEECVPRRVN